jgi:hypothetical protein
MLNLLGLELDLACIFWQTITKQKSCYLVDEMSGVERGKSTGI